jgi:hypothetical protein
MTSRTRRKVGLAWATALASLLSVHVQASNAVSLVSPPLLSPSVSTKLPLPQVPPLPVHLPPLPPVHVPLPPVPVLPVPVPPLPPVHLPPLPVHLPPLPPVQLPLPPVHLAPVPAGSNGPTLHLPIPGTSSIASATPAIPSTSGPASGKGLTRSPSVPPGSTARAMTASKANIAASSGRRSAFSPLSTPLSGYGRAGGSGTQHNATRRTNARLSKPERRRRLQLTAAVRRLEGCLGTLPDRLRVLLELSTGIDTTRALSPASVAVLLHVRVGQIPRLERQALLGLRRAARAHACGGGRRTPSGLPVLSGFGPPFGSSLATGGVEGVHYAKSPSPAPRGLGEKQASPGNETLLGINAPPAASEAWLVILVVLPGLLLVGFLFADRLGFGPRHWKWWPPWTRRPPR